MNEEAIIRRDRMRFTRNKLSANLAILAILFNVFYFVSLYQSDVGTYYYNILTGASIIYNLLFMLIAFLSSEGVKNYKKNYTWPLLFLGVMQIVRIFIIPTRAHNTIVSLGGVETPVMSDAKFTFQVVCLVVSAVCLFASAVVNFAKCTALEAHVKSLEENAAQGAEALPEKSAL